MRFCSFFLLSVCVAASATAQTGLCSWNDRDGTREVTWKTIVPQLLCDQKRIWTFPVTSALQHYPVETIAVVAGTSGLVFTDRYTAPFFRNNVAPLEGFNRIFSGQNTARAMEIFPIAFLGAAWMRHDSYAAQTAWLAGEAVLDSEILTTTMKDIDQRLRPVNVSDGNYVDTWFKDPRSHWGGHGSFPSGHTIAAMSLATVFAQRYGKRHKWVPYAAYATAGLIGISRLTLSSHYLSDVALGAGLGFTISRFVVLGMHSAEPATVSANRAKPSGTSN